eukprot:PhF_6_TR26338/c0_g1_i1/m.37888/K14844/PUF6; pumilio homology domain family member 6
MGRSNTEKERRRDDRLSKLPTSDRALTLATIKKKEGRILNAEERHALKMQGPKGNLLKLWEYIRQKSLSAEERASYVEQAMEIMKEDWDKFCRSPQSSRVIQSCAKTGTTSQVDVLYEMCAPNFVSLASDPFAIHVLCSIIRHCSHASFGPIVTQSVIPNVYEISESRTGLLVLDEVYSSEYCTAKLRQEVLCNLLGAHEEMKRVKGYPVLSDLTPKATYSQRIVEKADRILNKAKPTCEIMHALVLGAIQYVGDEEAPWKKEVFDQLRPHTRILAATSHEGSVLASSIFVFLPPKERKSLLGEISDAAVSLAGNKYGAPFLSSVIDNQSDAQVLHKTIISKWLEPEALEELLDMNNFRNFGKLLLRITTKDLKKKLVCVPEVWRRAYPMKNDEALGQRHKRIEGYLIGPVLECLMSKDVKAVSKLPGLRVVLGEIGRSLNTEGCEATAPEGFADWITSIVKRKEGDE